MSALEVVMMKRIGELNAEVKGLQAEVERLTKSHSDALADFWAIHKGYFDLKAEVERLRASSFVTAVPSEEYEKLKAEVGELCEAIKLASEVGIKMADEVTRLKAENERLRKAGDAVALDYAERIEIEAGDTAKNLMRKLPVLREWNAAKEDYSR